jgi:hypothetical protein
VSALWAPLTNWRESPSDPDVEARPSLRALPPASPRLARVPFILVLIAAFGIGMTGLLMLNTTLQNQAFQVSTLNRQANELTYTQADLESQIDQLAAPQELARKASADGLRPNPYPAFLVLPKGNIVGRPRPVTGNEVPAMIIKTPAELAVDRAAALARRQALAVQKVADAKAKAAQDRAKAAAATVKAAQQKVADARKAAAAKAAAARNAATAKNAAAAAKAAAAKKAATAKKAPSKQATTHAKVAAGTKKPGGRR